MYEVFYGLREKPFNLTPDPKFLYLSDKHKEAFAHLLYGIKNHSGFVMLTGEIGTGKTTICRNLLNQLDPETDIAFIFNPALSAIELLKKINGEFGIDCAADTALELVDTLNQYLLDAAARGRNCVLVIDEAQNLTPPVLEQIRLLSNLETEKDKLLQIILIGQPELAEVLALKELRQLNQRITARYHLKPLTETETLQYIAYRLHVAGGRRKVQFDRKAVRAIYKFSRGVPRVTNAVCDRALLVGYTKEVRTITAAIVRAAAREIHGERVRSRRSVFSQFLRRLVPSPALLVAAVVLVGLIFYGIVRPLENLLEEVTTQNARPAPAQTPSPPRPSTLETANASAPSTAPEAAAAQTSGRSDFITAMLDVEPATALQAASGALLSAWKLDPSATPPEDSSVQALTGFAARNNLSYEVLRPALEQLLAVNLPAFVKMRMGTKDLWIALAGVDGEQLRVTAAPEETVLAARQEFLAYYAAEAVVVWRDPNPAAQVLLPNTAGEPVARLKEALRRTGRLSPENTTAAYDAETAAAVSRLQADTGLLVDGRAGKQVRMVLTSWLPETPTPALRPLDVPVPEPHVQQTATVAPQAADAAPTAEPETPAAPEVAAEPAAETPPPAAAPPDDAFLETAPSPSPPEPAPASLPEDKPMAGTPPAAPAETPDAAPAPSAETSAPAEIPDAVPARSAETPAQFETPGTAPTPPAAPPEPPPAPPPPDRAQMIVMEELPKPDLGPVTEPAPPVEEPEKPATPPVPANAPLAPHDASGEG